MRILGCILAGGRSSRMGKHKAGVLLSSKPLLQHAIERLAGQVKTLIINANDLRGKIDYPIIADSIAGNVGPLAGVVAALEWAEQCAEKYDALVTVPVDAPFFPIDLVKQLSASSNHTFSIASCGNQLHPVFALWPMSVLIPLRNWLQETSNRSVKGFLHSTPHRIVDFAKPSDFDPFMNINTLQDLSDAERLIEKS